MHEPKWSLILKKSSREDTLKQGLGKISPKQNTTFWNVLPTWELSSPILLQNDAFLHIIFFNGNF